MISPTTNLDLPPRLQLSQQDVSRLITEQSPNVRLDVMQKIATSYQAQVFDAREIAIAEQIFRILTKDTEIRVRAALSERIKQDPNIPRDIVLSLAHDAREVALPVIAFSDVLSDADLVNIIERSGELSRLIAIAGRKTVSQRVASHLIETHESDVVSTLVRNEGADISERNFQQIVDVFSADTPVLQALAERSSVPYTVVEKIIHHVTDSLASELKRKYKLSEPQLRQETDRTRELATLKLTEGPVAPHEVETLVEQLHSFNRLTPSIILTSLCRGNMKFFETALAKLSGIPVENARILIGDQGSLGFRALYDKSGLPESMFDAAKVVLDVVLQVGEEGYQRGSKHYANRVVEGILAQTGSREIENIPYVIALIRQNAAA